MPASSHFEFLSRTVPLHCGKVNVLPVTGRNKGAFVTVAGGAAENTVTASPGLPICHR